MKDLFKKISKLLGNLGLITICAIIAAWGGQEKKWLRRFVYPAIISLYALYVVRNLWCLSIYSMSGVLSIGYGRFSPDDDKVSFLGNLAHKLFPQSPVLQDVMIRGIVGLALSLSIISIPILTGNWLSYLQGSLMIIVTWSLLSWRGMGKIPVKLFGKTINLLEVDIITYFATACGILITIHGISG